MKESTSVPSNNKNGRAGVIAVTLLLMAIAIATLWESREFSSLGSIFPKVIGIALLLASGAALVQVLRCRSAPARGLPASGMLRGVLLIGAVSAWIALLEPLGFAASGLICFVAIVLVTNRDPWTLRRIAFYAVSMVAIVFVFNYVFVELLNVTLPRGRWQ